MAETPPQPPGWPYNQDPNAGPPPPGDPVYEPPAAQPPSPPQYQPPPQPAAPAQPQQPPASYPAPAQPQQPPASYPAPAAAPQPQAPYESPVPGVAPAAAPYAQPGYPQPGYPQQYGGPGQPPPPPGWGAPVAPAKKSRRSLWITLGVIFGVLVLGIGACSIWFISAVTAPVDTSNDFLAAIDRGDYAEAISLTNPACSQGMSEAQLADVFQGRDIDYNLNNSSIVNSDATVSGSFSLVGESVSRIEVYLLNNDGWSVCGFDAN